MKILYNPLFVENGIGLNYGMSKTIKYFKKHLKDFDVKLDKDSKIAFTICLPNGFKPVYNRINVVWVQFETTTLPQNELDNLNKAEYIIVSNDRNKEYLERVLNRKIFVSLGGYDENIYKNTIDIKPQVFTQDREPIYTFLYCGALSERKGFDIAVEVFKDFNKLYPNTRLYIKTTEDGKDGITRDGNILYDYKNSKEENMVEYYNMCDCLILPSHGEGVGLTALEAAACGLPVIHTPFGGTEDFLPVSKSLAIDYLMSKIIIRNNFETEWAEPNKNYLFELMEEFVNNASKHQCLAKEIDVEDYTWKNFTKNIVEVFKIAEEEYKDFKVKKICNLGSGNDKMIGAVNVDIRSKTNPEIITDLNLDFWPIGVDYDEIYAMSIMEHLPNIISAMKNVYRILKNDGLFVMKVPYYKSITAFIDPTHVRFFTEQSMDYFDQSTYYGSINNYAEVNFKILEIKFIDNLPDENYRDLLFVMQKKEYIEN